MKLVYDRAIKLTKRAVSCIILPAEGWTETEQLAFATCKKTLAQQVTMSHCNLSRRLCVNTDKSGMA